MNENKKQIRVITLGYMLALLLVLYPFFADIYNNRAAERLINEYAQNVSDLPQADLSSYLEEAVSYNGTLYQTGSTEGYEDTLNVYGNGMMGYIVIPKIDVSLPVYHGTDDDTLDRGIGHLESSSLPVGGASTHCVLTGHRGLPGSRLFTYLDELEEGDQFYLKVLGETLAYEVSQIRVVLPQETESLAIQAGADLCTLITCTPYGVNSHRLLVTGTRTEYIPETEDAETEKSTPHLQDDILLIAAAAETVFYLFIRNNMKNTPAKDKRRRRSMKGEKP